jgi:uncharacterized protein with PhoU and TrkA domain
MNKKVRDLNIEIKRLTEINTQLTHNNILMEARIKNLDSELIKINNIIYSIAYQLKNVIS